MNKKSTPNSVVGLGIKRSIKQNIAKAWYQLDQQSYEQWLEGRKMSKSELNY